MWYLLTLRRLHSPQVVACHEFDLTGVPGFQFNSDCAEQDDLYVSVNDSETVSDDEGDTLKLADVLSGKSILSGRFLVCLMCGRRLWAMLFDSEYVGMKTSDELHFANSNTTVTVMMYTQQQETNQLSFVECVLWSSPTGVETGVTASVGTMQELQLL